MSLWNHPRLTAALCTVAVLGCAAAPAVFLAAADAASLGRVETVADPYVAPTPTADDYYILRQLAAVQNGELEPWELEGARSTLCSAYASVGDSQSKLENFWLGQTAAGLETGIEELVAQLEGEEITKESLLATSMGGN